MRVVSAHGTESGVFESGQATPANSVNEPTKPDDEAAGKRSTDISDEADDPGLSYSWANPDPYTLKKM